VVHVREDVAGGGALIDIGVHAIDLALYFLDHPEVVEVSGETARSSGVATTTRSSTMWGDDSGPEGFDVDDSASAFIRDADGNTISLEVAWATNRPTNDEFVIRGTEAGATFDRGSEELTFHEATAFDGDHHHFSDDEIETGESDSHAAEQVAFLDAVARRGRGARHQHDRGGAVRSARHRRDLPVLGARRGGPTGLKGRPHPLSEPIRSCVPFCEPTRDPRRRPDPALRTHRRPRRALRGVALLGILLINVWSFSMPEQTLLNPTVYGDFTGANYWAWAFSHVFGQNKFITLFSALFGAGILLFIDSKEEKGQDAVRLHYRRTAILIAIGLMHAYLLWVRRHPRRIRGVTALVVVAFRTSKPGSSPESAWSSCCSSPWSNCSPRSLSAATQSHRSGRRRKPRSNSRSRRTAAAGSNKLDHRVPSSFSRQTTGYINGPFWQVGGTMLLGMALYRWGVLTGERSAALYRRLVALGVVGLAITVAGVVFIEVNDWSATAALYWRQFIYIGSFPSPAATLDS